MKDLGIKMRVLEISVIGLEIAMNYLGTRKKA